MTKEEEEIQDGSLFLNLLLKREIVISHQDPPEPDLFITLNGNLIGIEHTRLVKEIGFGHKKNADIITDKAKYLFEQQSTVCLKVDISFSFNDQEGKLRFLTTRDIGLSEHICSFLLEKSPEIIEFRDIEYTQYTKGRKSQPLPDHIERIEVLYTPNYKSSCWKPCFGGIIPNVWDSMQLKSQIEKKDRLSKGYKKDYYQKWLLLVEDQSNLYSAFDLSVDKKAPIKSVFDRVFLLRRADNEFIELASG